MDFISVVYVMAGSIIGLIMGALPGLTVTMTAVLIVSLTYGWSMIYALAFILGAFCGAVTGGALSAITMNIPGTAAAVATVFDGYPLNRRGEATNAIGLSLLVSFIGGIFGIIFLWIFGPIIGSFALRFGSQEYFLITLWGLTLVAILSKGNFVKGMISACIGLFIGMIGMDPITGLMRFTFNSRMLSGGVNFVIAMIGLFGMKEVFVQLSSKTGFSSEVESYKVRALLPKPEIVKKAIKTIIWSGPIGSLIGLLPGTGGDIGALVAYGVTKQIIKKPSRPFGEGAYEGVAAPETANKAAIGGAMVTMLTLGIPGDSVTAVIMGSFYLHGLLPGPTFLINYPQFLNYIIWFLVVGMLGAYIFGVFGSNLMLRMLKLPKWFLIPLITILCITGSYALHNNISDVIFMIFFGLVGYFLERAKYPVSPIILAIILGPIMEVNFRQALINTGSIQDLVISFVARPISLVIIILLVASFVFQTKVFNKMEFSSKADNGNNKEK